MGRKRVYETEADRVRAFRERQAAQIKARQVETITTGIAPAPSVESIPATKRWAMLLQQAREAVETIKVEMETYAEGRSERWQDSEKAEDFQTKINAIEEIINAFESVET